jgi:hypothetical protein
MPSAMHRMALAAQPWMISARETSRQQRRRLDDQRPPDCQVEQPGSDRFVRGTRRVLHASAFLVDGSQSAASTLFAETRRGFCEAARTIISISRMPQELGHTDGGRAWRPRSQTASGRSEAPLITAGCSEA